MRRERLILIALIAGFVVLGAEVRYLHRHVVGEYWQGWIPIVYSGLAVLGCLIALAGNATARWIATGVFALGVVSGSLGFWLHIDGDLSKLNALVTLTPPTRSESEAEAGEEGEEGRPGPSERSGTEPKEEQPPALAPLGLAGLAVIGAIVAWPTKKSA